VLGSTAVGTIFCLAGCGQQDGINLARQACVHVGLSVHDFELSVRPGTPTAKSARLLSEADAQLRTALPLAADATSDNGSLNALMTTISEGATVDEAHLIPALKGQCAMVNTNVNVNPAGPSNPPGS
jgi:hypothetical protein